MAATTPKTILLQTNSMNDMRPHYSRLAAVATTPGDLVELTAAGKVTPIASLGKPSAKMFALESPFEPLVNTKSIDQAIPVDEEVRHIYAQRGDLVYARLATSQVVAVGDVLQASATAGCLAKIVVDATVFAEAPIGIAEEAVTTTGAVLRIKVRIL